MGISALCTLTLQCIDLSASSLVVPDELVIECFGGQVAAYLVGLLYFGKHLQ